MPLAKTRLATITSVTSTTATTIYTNPASTKSYIKGFVLHNAGTSAAFCKLHDVPNSGGAVGTAAAGNQFFSQFINAGETVFLEYPYPLTMISTNDTIQFKNDTSGQTINIQILGDRDP